MIKIGQVTDKLWYEAMNKVMDINLKPKDYTYPGNILITYQKDLSNRIYLDEYPEQKELRKQYLYDNYLIVLSLTENAYRKKKLKEF